MFFLRVVWLGEDRRVECRHPKDPNQDLVHLDLDPLVGCGYRVEAGMGAEVADTQGRLF